jgi:hypothetical protein
MINEKSRTTDLYRQFDLRWSLQGLLIQLKTRKHSPLFTGLGNTEENQQVK